MTMRIAIVNDSRVIVEALRRALEAVPGYRIAWTAADGEEAVRRCAADLPDIVLMDMHMPRLDGVEATRRIMHATPCPILVVTARIEGSVDKVYDAMAAGAVDAVDTPSLDGSDPGGMDALTHKINQISRLRRGRRSSRPPILEDHRGPLPPIIALGASTGGPAALADILVHLRKLPAAIVIVQHVDQHYAAGLASWLTSHAGLRVDIAISGARPQPGGALLAASADHLVMTAHGALGYTAKPAATPYRPSVDVFFRSLAAHRIAPGVAALLTGMGRDGADGLLQLRRAGWWTIAQDEASSVVYGMPRAAVELGGAASIQPLDRIGPEIREQVLARPR
jgi:chemotaxis response regulator CheB